MSDIPKTNAMRLLDQAGIPVPTFVRSKLGKVAKEIDTDLVRGLTSDEASLRYAKNGPNSLGEEKKTPRRLPGR